MVQSFLISLSSAERLARHFRTRTVLCFVSFVQSLLEHLPAKKKGWEEKKLESWDHDEPFRSWDTQRDRGCHIILSGYWLKDKDSHCFLGGFFTLISWWWRRCNGWWDWKSRAQFKMVKLTTDSSPGDRTRACQTDALTCLWGRIPEQKERLQA